MLGNRGHVTGGQRLAGSPPISPTEQPGPFRRDSERLLSAFRGGLTTIRSLSPAEARLLRPRAGTSPDRAPSGGATRLRCGTAPISVGHWPTAGAAPPVLSRTVNHRRSP